MDLASLTGTDWTLSGLLGLVVLLLLFGGLVPWRQHNLVLKREETKDAIIASLTKTTEIQAAQLMKFTELGSTAVKLLEAIPGTGAGGGEH